MGDAGTIVDTGLAYAEGEPVLVSIRARGRRYDPRDDGRALTRRVREASLAVDDALLELE